jgi:putative addiction module killer protein
MFLMGASKAAFPYHSHRVTLGASFKSARQSGSSDGDGLRDLRGRETVLARIKHLIGGKPGNAKPVWAGVCALRIHYGPGLRIYYLQNGTTLITLLAGGDKSSEVKDIQAVHQWQTTCQRNANRHHHQRIRRCRISPPNG